MSRYSTLSPTRVDSGGEADGRACADVLDAVTHKRGLQGQRSAICRKQAHQYPDIGQIAGGEDRQHPAPRDGGSGIHCADTSTRNVAAHDPRMDLP
jgi:hypothetical protein